MDKKDEEDFLASIIKIQIGVLKIMFLREKGKKREKGNLVASDQ